VVTGVVHQINKVKELYKQRGGRYHKVKDGQSIEVNIRDKAHKMLNGVMQFKYLVDAGLKFDPTGYGELR